MAMMFRNLRADEIDCRISQIKEGQDKKPYAVTLLLYKDARCDQNILDETVTPMRWKREHTRDNRNCIVSIWDDERKQWVSKEDTGTESNTEKEKGLASDSFKRACFNWGIGRELYTAPYIEIRTPNCEIKTGKTGKNVCWDNFTVSEIVYENDVIVGLKIVNQRLKKVVYQYGKEQEKPVAEEIAHEEEQTVQAPRATVTTHATVPPAEVTPETYLLKEVNRLQQKFGESFNFMNCRKALIDGGIVPNKRSNEMSMEEAETLIREIEKTWEVPA